MLKRHQVPPLQKSHRPAEPKAYARPIPGERIQMDLCKVGESKYQYTAVDDCTRMRVPALDSHKTAECSLDFLDRIFEEFPFPVQRIQTDRGLEFFAESFQERLLEYGIKFRPIKPRSPHLNGKVERSHKTDRQEFYSTISLDDPDIELRLAEWQHYYNWQRPHSSLGGKTPIERFCELVDSTPTWEEVCASYDSSRERIQLQNYQADLKLNRLKQGP